MVKLRAPACSEFSKAVVEKAEELAARCRINAGTPDQDAIMGRNAREKRVRAHRPEHAATPADVEEHSNGICARVGLDGRRL